MFSPPDYWQRQKSCNQFLDRRQGQNGRFRTWLGRKTRARNRDIAELAREDLDLAVPDVAWQASDAGQRENAAEKRMCRISDGNLAFAFLDD
jgi:hypothetical protein